MNQIETSSVKVNLYYTTTRNTTTIEVTNEVTKLFVWFHNNFRILYPISLNSNKNNKYYHKSNFLYFHLSKILLFIKEKDNEIFELFTSFYNIIDELDYGETFFIKIRFYVERVHSDSLLLIETSIHCGHYHGGRYYLNKEDTITNFEELLVCCSELKDIKIWKEYIISSNKVAIVE
jgi:hypothetical protein